MLRYFSAISFHLVPLSFAFQAIVDFNASNDDTIKLRIQQINVINECIYLACRLQSSSVCLVILTRSCLTQSTLAEWKISNYVIVGDLSARIRQFAQTDFACLHPEREWVIHALLMLESFERKSFRGMKESKTDYVENDLDAQQWWKHLNSFQVGWKIKLLFLRNFTFFLKCLESKMTHHSSTIATHRIL